MRSDGSADYVEKAVARRSSSTNPLVLRLHRFDLTRSSTPNQSQIAGSWSPEESESRVALIIRSDGTFDWSGTLEAHMACWHQLEHKGDRSRNLMDAAKVYEVIAAEYASVESSLRILIRDRGPNGEVYEASAALVAERINENTIHVSLDVDGGDQGRLNNTVTLHKNTTTQLREGSAWATLRGPLESQDSDS